MNPFEQIQNLKNTSAPPDGNNESNNFGKIILFLLGITIGGVVFYYVAHNNIRKNMEKYKRYK